MSRKTIEANSTDFWVFFETYFCFWSVDFPISVYESADFDWIGREFITLHSLKVLLGYICNTIIN